MQIINRIELRHLRYFIVVAEELHFRNAAKKLHITQPGLSHQIKDLENILETTLLHRSNKKVELTEAGTYLYDEARKILNQVEQSARTSQLIARGQIGEIRISFVGSAMHSILPGILSKMNRTYPFIKSTLAQYENKNQIELIKQNKIDIGFIRSEIIPQGMDYKKVYEEKFTLVLPSNHPLDHHNFKDLNQLRDEKFILFSQDYSYDYYHLVMSIFEDHGFQPKVSHRSVHASTIFHLVENGMGVAIVPTSLQKGFDLGIKCIELKSIRQCTVLHTIWKGDNRNPALHKFLKLL